MSHISGGAGWWKSPSPDLARAGAGNCPGLLYVRPGDAGDHLELVVAPERAHQIAEQGGDWSVSSSNEGAADMIVKMLHQLADRLRKAGEREGQEAAKLESQNRALEAYVLRQRARQAEIRQQVQDARTRAEDRARQASTDPRSRGSGETSAANTGPMHQRSRACRPRPVARARTRLWPRGRAAWGSRRLLGRRSPSGPFHEQRLWTHRLPTAGSHRVDGHERPLGRFASERHGPASRGVPGFPRAV